jgi:O-antigen/teichoic acid export membrane protein
MIEDLTRLVYRKETGQVICLYASMIMVMALGFGISIVNTRFLGAEWYGDFRLFIHFFTLVTTVTTFGFFTSGSKLLAQHENKYIRNELVGGILIVALIISLVIIFILFIFSFFVDNLFHQGLGRILRLFLPLLFAYPFQICLKNIMQGDNRILQLSIFEVGPKALYLPAVLILNYFVPLSLSSALAIHLMMLVVMILIMSWLSRPRYNAIGQMMSLIYKENKTYGFHVYLGALASVATASLLGVFIGYFVNTSAVGFFSLASAATLPLALIPHAFGTTLFKMFASRTSIPIKATVATIVISVLSLIMFLLLIEKIVLFFYSAEYRGVVKLAYIISIGNIFLGFGNFVNRFLGAHGKGKELRNACFAMGIPIVTGCFILVPFFGATGAAFAKSISGVVYCGMMCYYYRNYRNAVV